MRRLLFLLIFGVSLFLGLYLNHLSRYREVFRSICDLTEEHFYRNDAALVAWVRECHRRAAVTSGFGTTDQLLVNIQALMNELPVSHFQIYNPSEDRKMWKGEGIDSGIRARFIEDHLVVYRVFAGSAAGVAGVKPGDDIVGIAGAEQVTPWGAEHRSGRFHIKRGKADVFFDLVARDFIEDSVPRLTRLDSRTALVEIPSFRSDFFGDGAWKKFAAQFSAYSHLIVDLRDNSGGNLAAMLRALSSFQCGGRNVGVLLQPRKEAPDKPAFDDNLADDYQIKELEKYHSLGLVTFGNYGCFTGKVTLLVGPETSSVSEIFTSAIMARKNSRVWGQPTAGDVLLAVWFDLPALGPGFSVSIPEAVYLTPSKKELEGTGIWPQKELYYDLKQSLAGQDSWVVEALKF